MLRLLAVVALLLALVAVVALVLAVLSLLAAETRRREPPCNLYVAFPRKRPEIRSRPPLEQTEAANQLLADRGGLRRRSRK